MKDYTDLINFINTRSKEKGLCNRLYGLNKSNGVIYGLIDEQDEEIYWLPKHMLCSYHEELIDSWCKINERMS